MSPEEKARARIGNPHRVRVTGARPAVVLMAAGIALAGALAPAVAGTARSPAPALVRVSSDPIIKAGQEHATEAEPDTIAVGHSVLSSFMVGNVPTCTDDIGWAFSSDGGKTWTHGLLPGLTPYSTPPGPEKSVADTTDSWDAKYKEWVVSALNCSGAGGVTVSTSTNGTHWSNPISVFKGYISSADGGAVWSKPQVIAGPMKLTQFGDPDQGGAHIGGFAGDYVGASAIPHGNAVAVLPVGLPPATQKFNEPMETVAGGEPIKAQSP
jgi:hypothetical protein